MPCVFVAPQASYFTFESYQVGLFFKAQHFSRLQTAGHGYYCFGMLVGARRYRRLLFCCMKYAQEHDQFTIDLWFFVSGPLLRQSIHDRKSSQGAGDNGFVNVYGTRTKNNSTLALSRVSPKNTTFSIISRSLLHLAPIVYI